VHTTPEIIRKQFRISKLCQVFQGVLGPCTEEGFVRHRLHTLPSVAIVDNHGRDLIVPYPQLACILGLTRQSPLDIPRQDLRAFSRQPPFEALYLAMGVGESPKVIPQRTRLLQEAEQFFLDLMEQNIPIFVVAISHRRLIHGRIVVRHQPACILDLDGRTLWLHPAALIFGLIEVAFPRSQRQRQLGPVFCRERDPMALARQDDDGIPQWHHQAREAVNRSALDDPLADAFMDLEAKTILQCAVEAEAEERLLFAAQEFLAGFESYFGMGGLFPEPGTLDAP